MNDNNNDGKERKQHTTIVSNDVLETKETKKKGEQDEDVDDPFLNHQAKASAIPILLSMDPRQSQTTMGKGLQ